MTVFSCAKGDFVVFNYFGKRRRGVVIGRSYTYRPVILTLDICVKRKWMDYLEYARLRGLSLIYARRIVTGSKGCVVKVLPKHKLVPYKLMGLLDNVESYV